MSAAEKTQTEADGAEKRTFRGMFVHPRAQFVWCALLSLGFLILCAFLIVIMVSFNNSVDQLRQTYQLDTDTAALITGNIFFYLRMAITLSVFFAVSGLSIGIMLSHRIYGPMVPILAHIRRLIEGQYSSRARLRAGDEFEELVTELNQLAEKLEKNS